MRIFKLDDLVCTLVLEFGTLLLSPSFRKPPGMSSHCHAKDRPSSLRSLLAFLDHHNKCQRPGSSSQRDFSSHKPRGWSLRKSVGSAGSPSKDSSLGSHLAAFSLCLHNVFHVCVCVCVSNDKIPFSCKDDTVRRVPY